MLERTDKTASSFSLTDGAAKTTNVLVVGVGGQGVILVSKVLAVLVQSQGFKVKQSEVHGMAKRGGGVFSHIRYGEQVWSPTIPKGEADILVALEWAEGMRWINQLNPAHGTFISDTRKIIPPFACRNRKVGADLAYSRETPAEILEHVATGYALDATGMAAELGEERAANTILLGVLSTALDFEVDDWLRALLKFVPPKTKELNERAFLLGRDWVNKATIPDSADFETARTPQADCRPVLEIVPEWCKGCDICVKMCPERILSLNADQIVQIDDPDACTGCHICEWLCPDFAIKINLVATSALAEASAPAKV